MLEGGVKDPSFQPVQLKKKDKENEIKTSLFSVFFFHLQSPDFPREHIFHG